MAVTAAQRDGWLRQTDTALRSACREERYRTGGPGGQRRNKVETAVRLHHEASGVSVYADDSRYVQANRTRALRRLRERIACDVRASFNIEASAPPPELVAQRGPKGTLSVNARNPAYPIIMATTLDALAAAGGSYAKAGRGLGITTSQVLRFLRADRQLWRAAEGIRKQRNS